MRIVHVTDVFAPQVGGIETFVEGLATRQSAQGHEVSVLTRTPAPSGTGGAPSALDVRRIGVRSAWAQDLAAADVVHVHLSVLSPLATWASRQATGAGVPTVASVHSLWAGRSPVVRAASLTGGWTHAPILWTPVSGIAGTQVHHVLPTAQIQVVPNAIDVAWWREITPQTDPVPTLLTTMRLVPRKRPFDFLRTVAEVHQRLGGMPLRAVVVGTGPLARRLEREVVRLGLDEVVELVGQRTPAEIRELCSRSWAYVAPATLESFGIAALEARAAGLPVVAMRRGGVAEFIRHGREGLLCEDDAAMAVALSMLLTDRPLRDTLAAHNRAHPPPADWAEAVQRFGLAYGRAANLARSPGRHRAWASA